MWLQRSSYFGAKAGEILKQSDEISWRGYTLGCPPRGPFGISIREAGFVDQMTLPWVFELCGAAGGLAGSHAGAWGFCSGHVQTCRCHVGADGQQ